MACGSGTLHDPGNETADAGRHGFPDSCGIGVSAGYGIVDCIADSAAASIRSKYISYLRYHVLGIKSNFTPVFYYYIIHVIITARRPDILKG